MTSKQFYALLVVCDLSTMLHDLVNEARGFLSSGLTEGCALRSPLGTVWQRWPDAFQGED